jgi:type IV pilus assembly protein PilX
MDVHMNESSIVAGRSHTGAALVISLVILLVLTVLGVAGMRSSTLEERMAGNARDRHMAFEAAEAALLAGEQHLRVNVFFTDNFDTIGTDGMYNDSTSYSNIWQAIQWTDDDSLAYDGDVGTAAPPRFVIQHYDTIAATADQLNLDNYGQGTGAGAIGLFRITARGTGGSNETPVILQSTYAHQVDR